MNDVARLDVDRPLDFGPVVDGFPALLWGCAGTLGLALGGMALATVIGVGGVMLRNGYLKPLRWLVIVFVELTRNTPFLVQIYFIFFALPLAGLRRSEPSAGAGAPPRRPARHA